MTTTTTTTTTTTAPAAVAPQSLPPAPALPEADATKAMDIFLRLCVNDITLSIDDFGTGFSSLQQLYQLPFDELKIDRMFVTGLPDDDEARAIVRAIVDMAHALNIKVCAEGVETRAALDYLESVNCDRAQGYFISAAVDATEFERFVASWNQANRPPIVR
jgi:EAL domain-containing protein (putative c-di-GMP-specific phosphodiesterase class I)